MQAIILAAGMGRRLGELTQNNTKCMVKVNGVPLIDRMLRQIESRRLSRVVVVVGYEGRKLMGHIAGLGIKTPVIYVENPVYDRTNNIYSLSLAREYLCEEDTLLFESDLIFEDSVIDALLEDPRDTLALVDKYENWMDGTCVKLSEDDTIEAFVPGEKFKFEEKDEYYKTVNIYKFSREFSRDYYVPFLQAYTKALGDNEYYEQVLRVITMLDKPVIRAKRLEDQAWYEIDDVQDLDIAASLFMPDAEERVTLLQGRFGGYWRYPKLVDFSYLVNPYFPPQRMMDEIKANFEKLLTQYPSGMRVNSLLAAKNFGVRQGNIAVGNGAAELIKSYMAGLCGKAGVVRPTFEEYPNRYSPAETVVYVPEDENFVYGAGDVMAYFDGKGIQSLVIINPDNPTGNYMCREEMLKLVAWTKERGIQLLVDESFADFADEESPTLIRQGLLMGNPHLSVMKSISKSYGVPGLRLGVLASGDTERIAAVKQDVAIWNINSFAEFYMQIAEKYRKDYGEALARVREERGRFAGALGGVPGIRAIPSQANYIMIEITGGMGASELTRRLLFAHNLFVKDLSGKISRDGRQFIRVAVRNTEDNNRLVDALKCEL